MRFYAMPYDYEARGFYFSGAEEYETKAKASVNSYGQPVEDYEIQFIDGGEIGSTLARAFGLNQCNFAKFIEFMDNGYSDRAYAAAWWLWHNRMKTVEQVYELDEDDLESYVLHECDCALNEDGAVEYYAYSYLEETGQLNSIPEPLRYYFDYAAFARNMRLNGVVDAKEFNDTWYIFDALAD